MKKEIYYNNKQLDKYEAAIKLEEMLFKLEDKVLYHLEQEEEE